MALQILKRLSDLILVLLGVTMLAFLLSRLSSVDPAEAYVRRTVFNATPEQIRAASESMGYDRPIHEQYISWLSGCLRGDFGTSLLTRSPVSQDLAKKLPVTLSVVGLSAVWTALFAVPISLLCVKKKDSLFDRLARGVTIAGISVPSFWLSFILLLLFANHLSWFKVVDPDSFRGLILPSFTVSVPVTALMVRMLRAGLLAEMRNDYVFYARARGLSVSRVLWRHALPNALPPIITMFSQFLGSMIAGSAVVESIFSLKGIGSYLLDAIIAYDIPAINGCVVVIAAIFIAAGFVSEIINARISPRTAAIGGQHG